MRGFGGRDRGRIAEEGQEARVKTKVERLERQEGFRPLMEKW